MDEVFGAENLLSVVDIRKNTMALGPLTTVAVCDDYLALVCKGHKQIKYPPICTVQDDVSRGVTPYMVPS